MDPELVQNALVFLESKERVQYIDIGKNLETTDPKKIFRAIQFLLDEKLIERKGDLYFLASFGFRVLHEHGTWSKYLENLALEKDLIEADKELERENKRWSIRQNKWLHKTRWWPLILSFISLGISIFIMITKQ